VCCWRKSEADKRECNEQSEEFHDLILVLMVVASEPSQFSPAGRMSRGGLMLLARLNASGIVLLRAGMSQQFFRAKSDLAGMAMVSMISLPDGQSGEILARYYA